MANDARGTARTQQRTTRGAVLPALLAPLVLLALLVGAWALNKAVLDDDSGPARPDAPLWRWLLEANNALWGPTPFATGNDARAIIATGVSALVILVVGFVGTLVVVRGLAPGSSAFSAFAGTWLVSTVATVAGATAWWITLNRGRLSFPGAGQSEFAVLTNGLQYGAKYGWLAALVATLAWLAVRPVPTRPRHPDAGGRLGPPAPYPAERERAFRGRTLTDAPADEPAGEATRTMEIGPDGDVVVPGSDPHEPRPNETPPSLLDQHAQPVSQPVSRPMPDTDPFGYARQAPAPAPVPAPPETEPETRPYVGRRRAGVPPTAPTPDPPSGPPSDPLSGPPHGSHRAPTD